MVTKEEQQPQHQENDEIDLLEVGLKLWSLRKFIIIFTSAFVVLAVIYALIKDPRYESQVTLYQVSSQEGGGSRIGALASQFGLGGSLGGGSSNFNIKDLVNSRKIRDRVIFNTWYSEEKEDSMNLIEYWEIEAETEAEKVDAALKTISESITHSLDEETGLHSITVKMPEPQIAADIANFISQSVADYVQHEQKSQTRMNIKYIDKRLETVKRQLTKAEEALKEFRENNVRASSPQLMLEQGRLQRQVTIKQEVYLTLQKEKEMAQIDLVKETPVINILDEAVEPQQRSEPKRKLIVIIGGFLGGFLSLLGVIGYLVYNYLKRAIAEKKQENPEAGEVASKE